MTLKKLIKQRDQLIKTLLLYAFLIVLLGNSLNFFFRLKPVQEFILSGIKNMGLDVMFYDFLYFSEPYIYFGDLVFLKAYVWILPYVFFSFLVGWAHVLIFEKRLDIRQINTISLYVFLLKLFSFSVPYGIYPILFYFFGFIKEYFLVSVSLLPFCFVGLFMGTELAVAWVVNKGEEAMMDRYNL